MPNLVELSRAVAPSSEYRPAPRFVRLFPFQHAAVEQHEPNDAVRLRQHMLLAHPPGAGKTPMALALREGGDYTLIVCPPSLCTQWARRWEEWIGHPIGIHRTGAEVALLEVTGAFRCAIVPDSLVHLVPKEFEPDLLIIDEVHRMKTRTSRRTKTTFGERGVAQRSARIIGLTGTPLLNSPIDLYPFLSVAAPHVAMTFDAFTQRYCPPVEMRVRGAPYPIKRYDLKMQNLDELAHNLRASVMIRPPAGECLAQLPPMIEDEWELFDVKDPAEDTYSVTELAAIFENAAPGESDPEAVATMRRQTGMAKAEDARLLAYLSDLIEGGERPLIWCWHQGVVNKLAAHLGLDYIHGAVPMAARDGSVQRYQSGETKGLVLTIGAAGTGLDGLQQSGSLMVFVERSYVPAENEQAVARLFRAGQTRGVRSIIIRTDLIVDRAIESALKRKLSMATKALA